MGGALYLDKGIMLPVILLIIIGLVFIYSVSAFNCQEKGLPSWYYLARQLVWLVLAFVVLVVFSRLDYHLILKLSPFLLIVGLILLVAVLKAPPRQKVHRWLVLPFIQLQPSELFKVALFIYLARTVAKQKAKRSALQKNVLRVGLVGFGLWLIAKQPDLGTLATTFLAILIMLFLAGVKLRYLIVSLAIVAAFVSHRVFDSGYEKDRISDYFALLENPFAPTGQPGLGKGFYQAKQSLISIGSGGIWGRGLGMGGQKNLFLPAPHTDFIFAASAEEGGFFLCLTVLALFLLFFRGAMKVASAAADLEGYLLASGLGLLLTLQAALNIAVAVGLVPITGITLPFVSYGGSSLVICCASVGLILSVARVSKRHEITAVRLR